MPVFEHMFPTVCDSLLWPRGSLENQTSAVVFFQRLDIKCVVFGADFYICKGVEQNTAEDC